MKNRQAIAITAMLLLVLTLSGCSLQDLFGDPEIEKPLPMPPDSASPAELLPEDFAMNVYFDTTISMRGFTTLMAGNMYRQLPNTLDDLGSEVHFYRFGDEIVPVEGRDHLQFRDPETYTDLVNSLGNVIDKTNAENLSVIITDLFEDKADWSNVTQKIREKIFSENKAVAIIGIRNSFSGEIFDVGINAESFSYDSGEDSFRFRPFYLFVTGSESQVRAFLKKWKASDLPLNEKQYVVFAEHFSSAPVNLRVADAQPVDRKNLYEDRQLLKSDERLQEIVIPDSSEEVSIKIPMKFEPYPDNCAISTDQLIKQVRIFSWNGETWQELEGKWQQQAGKDADVSFSQKNGDNYELELKFQPQSLLPQGSIVCVQVQVVPSSAGLDLPSWISAWNMSDADIETSQFDGTKTVNLKRIATSLKDSFLSGAHSTIAELDLVIDRR